MSKKKYAVSVPTRVWVTVVIEAESKDEAVDLAWDEFGEEFRLRSYGLGTKFGIDHPPNNVNLDMDLDPDFENMDCYLVEEE